MTLACEQIGQRRAGSGVGPPPGATWVSFLLQEGRALAKQTLNHSAFSRAAFPAELSRPGAAVSFPGSVALALPFLPAMMVMVPVP